ncbi:TPA: DUF3800 domain-containing protein [Campylobacter jejuni]|nr:DUF3800 domain-containing protein [Campylobacter jejuni]
MNKNNFILFMDETGTLSNDINQPYFGLGILKLKETSNLLQKIYSVKNKKIHYKELKFSKIRYKGDVSYIKKLIDICFEYEYFNFYAFVIDKQNIENKKEDKNIWQLYIKFVKQHIEEKCRMKDEKVCILADYFSKPKNEKSFEESIIDSNKVFNACMLESESSIFIQLVDIFIGAIAYKINPNNQGKKNNKMKICLYLEKKLAEKQRENKKQINKKELEYKGTINNNFILDNGKFYFSLYKK